MATIIMDPRASTDGTGSAASPWNTWSGKTFVAGNSYLQVAGTRYTGQLRCNQAGTSESARISFGSYGTGPKPILDGSNGQQRVVQIGASAHYVTIDGFEITGANDPVNANFGVYWGFSATPAHYGKLLNCDIHSITGEHATFDCDLVQAYGDHFWVEGCDIHDAPDDGLWIQGAAPTIIDNIIRQVGTDSSSSGDCIQINGASTGYLITGNSLDHSNVAEKQAFIISSAGAGAGGIFAYNHVVFKVAPGNVFSCVYSDQPGDMFVGNEIVGGNYGFNLVAANQVVMSNIIKRAERGCVITSAGATPIIVKNIFDGNTIYGLYCDTTLATIHNNIFINNAIGMARKSTATYSRNAYYGNTTASAFIGAAGAAESGTVTDALLLRPDYRPYSTSPIIGAGMQIAGVMLRDFYGKHVDGKVDIGAYQYRATRSLASSRSLASRTIVSRPASASR